MEQSHMASTPTPEGKKEIEFVKTLVAKRFPVYDVRVSYDVVQFYCRVDEATLETTFEELRKDMAPHGYIPMITYEKGEHVIIVGKKPPQKYRSIYVNLVMLIITFVAMMFAGVLDWSSYADVPSDEMFSAETIGTGILVFTLPLMAILAVHELGHFFAARRRHVAASLPFFIPSIPPLGTFGAFISLRDPIPSRKALLEIGVAGPLAGLAVAIPLGIAGLMLTNMEARPIPEDFATGDVVSISFPMIYLGLEWLVPIEGDYLLHPTAFAAWVGFLVTALNLLPAGQLDGGHIARAVFGSKAKYASYVTIALLIALGIFYLSWILFAILIMFLGSRHPPPLNDINRLDLKRQVLGVFAFAVLVVAFVPIPMIPISVDYSFEATALEPTEANITPGAVMSYHLLIENLGNGKNNITFEKVTSPAGWGVLFKQSNESDEMLAETYSLHLSYAENATMIVNISSPSSARQGISSVIIRMWSPGVQTGEGLEVRITYTFNVTYPTIEHWVIDNGVTIPPDSSRTIRIQTNNSAPEVANLTFVVRDLPGYVGVVLFVSDPVTESATGVLNMSIPAQTEVVWGAEVFVWASAEPGPKMFYIDVYYNEEISTTIAVMFSIS